MRCFTIAAVVAVSAVALTQIASAADLPRKAPAYIPLSPPILSWTGWYAGLNAGGMWSNQDVDTVSTSTLAAPGLNPASGPAAAAAGSTSIPANSSGFIGGGQIGYNWQFMPQWVAGLEADIQGISRGNGTDAVSQAVVVPNSGGDFWTATTNVSSRLDYLGTGRGRVGYLVTPTLLAFGTAVLLMAGSSSRPPYRGSAPRSETGVLLQMYFLEAARSRRRGSAGRLARESSGWLGRTGVSRPNTSITIWALSAITSIRFGLPPGSATAFPTWQVNPRRDSMAISSASV